MRRMVLFLLVLLFSVQSTGAAALEDSARPSVLPSVLAQVRIDLEQMVASAAATRIGALLTGNGDRWNLMHASAPARVVPVKSEPSVVGHRGLVRPTPLGAAIRGTPPEMLKAPLLPKDAAKLHPPNIVGGSSNTASRTSAPAARPPTIGGFFSRAPGSTHPASARSRIHPMDVTAGSPNTAGINPWWTYEGAELPGVGYYMVNVANGNLFATSKDVDIPERGVDLVFQRTYNSQSLRNWNASGQSDDGSPTPSTYGSGWTNTYDTHLANNASGGISVFDNDGARYDYTPNGTGCLTGPPGVHDTLCYDGGCGYFWGAKDGTIYYYWAPWLSTNCGSGGAAEAAYSGRLYMIFGRNNNNWIRLVYSWNNNDPSTTSNLSQIVAQHENGQALTLTFGTINGKVLLSSVTRPDGQQVAYLYPNPQSNNAFGNLEEVDLPGNNQGTIRQQYGYYASNGTMNWVNTPRWYASGAGEGAYTWFDYNGAGEISDVQLFGWANFTPSDGLGIVLQNDHPNQYGVIRYSTFAYLNGQTQFGDVDGHATNWFFDSSGRVSQTQSWTGALWLVANASWDVDNNLTESVDARGYATDYAYDSNGNLTATALPQVTSNEGTFRPTTLYSYDRTNGANNVIAACDPVRSHAIGQDWTGNPGQSDTLCPNSAGATRYSWDYTDSPEPFGRLRATYTPLGYHRSYSYDPNAQGGDFGLLTSDAGDCVSQNDGSNRCPNISFGYDARGNTTSYNRGNGVWSISYDQLNERTSVSDPDGVTARACYYLNGQVSAIQSALQYQMDGNVLCGPHSRSFTYDLNGNKKTDTAHFGNVAGTTTNWYDGADRLVEVQLPSDAQDIFTNAWTTRYLYDLSQNGTVTISGSGSQSYAAHGGLFKTQELLMPGTSQQLSWYYGSPRLNNTTFQDIRGLARDAVGRITAKFHFVADAPQKVTISYDGNSNSYGHPTQFCDVANVCGNLTYDGTGQITQVSYNDSSTASESNSYDPDGRNVGITSSAFGTQSYSYDADGRLAQATEPSGGGVTSPATLTYHYYGDGRRSSLDVSSAGLSQNSLFALSYRADGALTQQQINLSANSNVGNSALNYSFSAAGRMLQRTETGPIANAAALTVSYDINNGSNTGNMTSVTYPAATANGFTYDAQGETLGYQESIANVGTTTKSFAYSDRGEQVMDSRAIVPSGSSANSNFADGVTIAGTSARVAVSWDARMGSQTGTFDPSGSDTPVSTTFSFDGDGRQNGRVDVTYDRFGNEHDYGSSRQYDAENRLKSGSQQKHGTGILGTSNTLTAFQWGPNGLPALVGSTPIVSNATPSTSQLAYDTLHWDGGQLLFTTNPQGQVDDIKIGSGADITPLDPGYSGMTSWDRLAGSVAFCHNSSGAAGNDSGPTSHTTSGCTIAGSQSIAQPSTMIWSGSLTTAAGIGQGKIMGMPGSDGLADGVELLQGLRAFDPQLGGWTAPDPRLGDLRDPMSQKSYVWNNANPMEFSDPMGLQACGGECTVGPIGTLRNQNGQLTFYDANGQPAHFKLVANVESGDNGEQWGGDIGGLVGGCVGGCWDSEIPFLDVITGAAGERVGRFGLSRAGRTIGEYVFNIPPEPPWLHNTFGVVTQIENLAGFVRSGLKVIADIVVHPKVPITPSSRLTLSPEGLQGAADAVQSALGQGGPSPLNTCGSCALAGQDPYPGAGYHPVLPH